MSGRPAACSARAFRSPRAPRARCRPRPLPARPGPVRRGRALRGRCSRGPARRGPVRPEPARRGPVRPRASPPRASPARASLRPQSVTGETSGHGTLAGETLAGASDAGGASMTRCYSASVDRRHIILGPGSAPPGSSFVPSFPGPRFHDAVPGPAAQPATPSPPTCCPCSRSLPWPGRSQPRRCSAALGAVRSCPRLPSCLRLLPRRPLSRAEFPSDGAITPARSLVMAPLPGLGPGRTRHRHCWTRARLTSCATFASSFSR